MSAKLSFCVIIACFGLGWTQDLKSQQTLQAHYMEIGSMVHLHCLNGTHKGKEWRLNGLPLVISPVLNLHNVTLENQGNYTCHSPNGDVITGLNLQLGYAPSPPEIRCWSPSYPLKALCSWTLKDSLLPTRVFSTYWYQGVLHPCLRESEEDTQCVLKGLELYSNDPYLVNITVVNALGKAGRILSVSFEDIVKPDPPVNVTATVLPGKKVNVRWAAPPTWPDRVNFPLKYYVKFQWENHGQSTIMGPYESESMVRSGMVTGRTYHIRVSCLEFLGHGKRSDFSDAVNITLPKS